MSDTQAVFEISKNAKDLVVEYGICSATYIVNKDEASQEDYGESFLRLLVYIGTFETFIEKNNLLEDVRKEIARLEEFVKAQRKGERKWVTDTDTE